MPLPASILYCILALVGTARRFVHFGWAAGAIKTLPVAVLAWCAWVYTRSRFGPWVAVAVAFGAVGDYSLTISGHKWFLVGLCAFLAGHVAYSVAFARDLRWTRARGAVIGLTVLVMASLAAALSVRMAHKGDYVMIAPVALYVTVMAVMMALAVLHESPTKLIAVGAVVFVIADAHIAVGRIMPGSGHLALALSGSVTYYLAQYLLVAGAAYESRSGTSRSS